MTKNHGHTNSTGVEMTSLPLIAEPLDRPKVFTVVRLQPFGSSGSRLENTKSRPPIIYSNQAIATIDRRVHGDRNISLGSLEICTEVRRGGFGRSTNEFIRMNPSGTTRSNCPQFTRQGRFDL